MPDWDGTFATMPKTWKPGGRPVPDLARIPEDLWEEVLLPLSEPERRDAAFNLALGDRMQDAIALKESLPPGPSPSLARRSAAEGTAIPAPRAEHRHTSVQVNFRIDRPNHEKLVTAAELLGHKPTQLARMLVVNGVNRIFADQARLAVGRADDEDRRGG